MVVDEFYVNDDGKGKEMSPLAKSHKHEFDKNIFPLNLNKPYKFLFRLYI